MNALPEFHHSLLDLSKLPTLPESLVELIDACNDDDINIQDISNIVVRDASLSARILQLANSAFLGTRSTFSDIQQAVIYLGIDTIRNLAISTSIYEVFKAGRTNGPISIAQFWYHSFATASLARLLAEKCGYPNPAEAYLTGLLHDMGKLLLSTTFSADYIKLVADNPDGATLAEREQDRFGVSHAEAGAILLRHWKLPATIGAAVEQHHTYVPGSSPVVSLADLLYFSNQNPTDDTETDDPPAIHFLSAEQYQQCQNAASLKVSNIAGALGIKVEPGSIYREDQLTEELQHRISPLSRLYGCLDNLLKARNRNRICQVVEESLKILFSIEKSVIVVHQSKTNRGEILLSNTNPITGKFAGCSSRIAGEIQASSILQKIFRKSQIGLVSASEAMDDSVVQKLSGILESETLMAVPFETGDNFRGALLVGLARDKADRLINEPSTFLSLASHAGARLQLGYMIEAQAREVVERELGAIETVTRSVAHEITNPLGIIQNYLALLKTRLGGATAEVTDLAEELGLLQVEIERIATVTRQLNNIRNIQATAATEKTEPLEMIINNSVSLFSQSLFSKLDIRVNAYLEPRCRMIAVPGKMLRQVLGILFHNAADAMPDGGELYLKGYLADDVPALNQRLLVLTISDTGPGVAPDLIDSLFNAGVTTKEDGHLGLGLSIARKQIVDHNGKISMESPVEGGCRFIIKLPVNILGI